MVAAGRQSITLDQPLADRLVEAVDVLDAHLGRMGAVIGALHASGTPNRRPRTAPIAPGTTRSPGRDVAQAATRQAVLELFAPDRAGLRLPADECTDAFLAVFFGHGRRGPSPAVTTARLVDLFLHGARKPPEPA